MKKIKVLDVVNINKAFDGVTLQGAPIEDVKAILRFRREAQPVVNGWDDLLKDAIAKLKGETITEEQLNKHLNEALADEANREVEITPFAISEDGEVAILAQSRVECGQWEAIKDALKPVEKEQ